MKMKKTLALILSLATVFSAAFTSMADVAVVEEIELTDQNEVTEEPAVAVSDNLSAATVEEVVEVAEVVEEESIGEEKAETIAKTGLLNGTGGTSSIYWAVKDNVLYIGNSEGDVREYGTAIDYSKITWSGSSIKKVVFVSKVSPASTKNWFNNSGNLEIIEGMSQNLDTSAVTDMSFMFYCCKELTELDLSGFDTSQVTTMNNMFGECNKLSSLDLSTFNTSAVTNMSKMFYSCPVLTTIFVGEGFDTRKVTSSNNMFGDCSKLKGGAGTEYNSSYIDKEYARIDGGTRSPGYFTEKISPWKMLQREINDAGTSSKTIILTQDIIAVPSDDKLVIKDGQNITIDLNGYNIIKDSKESGGGNCITVGNNEGGAAILTIKDESTATHSFKVGDDGLWVLDSNGDKTLIGGCIMGLNPDPSNCDGIGVFINGGGTLNLHGGNIVGNKAGRGGGGVVVCDGAVFNMNGGSVTGNTAGENGGGIYVDGELHVFGGSITDNSLDGGTIANNVYLPNGKYITIGENCSSTAKVGVTTKTAPTEGNPVVFTSNGTAEDVEYFEADNAAYAVEFEDGHLQLVKGAPSKGWSLDDEGVLTIFGEVTHDGFDSPWEKHADEIKSVVTKEGAKINNCYDLFNGCENLVSADLSHLDTSEVTNMENMFVSCGALTTLNLDGLNTSNVTNMAGMFALCASLEKIDLSMFNTSKVMDMAYMFNGCKALQELDLSDFNTSNVEGMTRMFQNCGNLKTIFASESFKTDKVREAEREGIFANCKNLKGGAGTTFDPSMADGITYVRIDDPAHGKPGLFFRKEAPENQYSQVRV